MVYRILFFLCVEQDNDVCGRPSTSFESSSNRTKRRRTATIREEHSVHELSFATEMSLRAAGRLDAAKIVKDVTEGSPSKAVRYRKSLERVEGIPMNGDEAVAFMVENELSKNQYCGMRSNAISRNFSLYPSYNVVLEAKKNVTCLNHKYL